MRSQVGKEKQEILVDFNFKLTQPQNELQT